MQTKLTLRLEEELIRQAKSYARETGRSVSQLVAAYFAALIAADGERPKLTPTVRSLKGILRGHQIDEEDYRRHLEAKYS